MSDRAPWHEPDDDPETTLRILRGSRHPLDEWVRFDEAARARMWREAAERNRRDVRRIDFWLAIISLSEHGAERHRSAPKADRGRGDRFRGTWSRRAGTSSPGPANTGRANPCPGRWSTWLTSSQRHHHPDGVVLLAGAAARSRARPARGGLAAATVIRSGPSSDPPETVAAMPPSREVVWGARSRRAARPPRERRVVGSMPIPRSRTSPSRRQGSCLVPERTLVGLGNPPHCGEGLRRVSIPA